MQNPSFFARKGVFAGETFAGSLRFSIKVAAGGRFAAQIESAPKRNTTRVGGVSFCHVLAEKILDFSLPARKGMFAKEAIARFSLLFNSSAG